MAQANQVYHKRDLYSEVTSRILTELETGAAPWIKPWSATSGLNHPHNAASGRPYSGCNVVLLWMAQQRLGWKIPKYVTFKQAQELGGSVKKGEHGTKVYFVKQLQVQDKENPETQRTIPMLKEYTVFNIDQCESLPTGILDPQAKAPRNKDQRDPLADEFLGMADIREGNGEAYYVPSKDFISLPAFGAFKNADSFYSTAFHELGHWTGAKPRLDRSLQGRFGDQAYAAEELIAELCAAFLCAEFSMDGELRHAGYIASWFKLLKHDSRAFFTAASKAQAAADYLRGLALSSEAEIKVAA
jgi:antirestriction protein ArdC